MLRKHLLHDVCRRTQAPIAANANVPDAEKAAAAVGARLLLPVAADGDGKREWSIAKGQTF